MFNTPLVSAVVTTPADVDALIDEAIMRLLVHLLVRACCPLPAISNILDSDLCK
jgi:hypothetical protein